MIERLIAERGLQGRILDYLAGLDASFLPGSFEFTNSGDLPGSLSARLQQISFGRLAIANQAIEI